MSKPNPKPTWYYARAIQPVGYRVFERVSNSDVPVSVLVFDPYFARFAQDPFEKVLLSLPAAALDVDLILVRGLTDDTRPAAREHVQQALHRHTSRSTAISEVIIPPPSSKGRIRIEPWSGDLPCDEGALLQEARSIELDAQLLWTRAVLRPEDAHFELPAGTHANAFIRTGDTLAEITFVERLADWFADDLDGTAVVAADTWSLLPLLQELADRSRMSTGRKPMIVTFRSYPTTVHVEQLIGSIRSAMTEESDAKLLFVLSVISSAQVLNTLKSVAPMLGGRARVVVRALVDTNTAEFGRAFTVEDNVSRFDVQRGEPCTLCVDPKRRPLILIDARKYIPAVRGLSKPQMLHHEAARAHAALWEAATRTGAIRLHADDFSTGERRHFPVSFDVAALLSDRQFFRTTVQKLRTHAPLCDLIVVPDHEATDSLIQLAEYAYSKPTVVRVPSAVFGQESDEQREAVHAMNERLREELTDAEYILILDDAIIQGRRVRSLHRYLQRSVTSLPKGHGPGRYQISAFAVLARPATQGRWNRLMASLRQSDGITLAAGVQVFLSDDHLRCPWCRERDILGEISASLSDPHRRSQVVTATGLSADEFDAGERAIQARLDHLKPSAPGPRHLDRWLYLCGPRGEQNPKHVEPLTRNSLFGETLSEAASYAGVAEALQSLRNRWPASQGVHYVWDVPKVLTAYHDPLLSAAFLRAVFAEEIGLSEQGQDFEDALAEISFASDDEEFRQSPILAAEIDWAVLSGTIPEEFGQRVEARIRPILDSVPVPLRAMLRIIQTVHAPNLRRG